MIEKIEKDGKLIAIILRGSYEGQGVNFFTRPEDPLQLGVLNHKKEKVIKPHLHKSTSRNINVVQEVLHIERGLVEAFFYDDKGASIGSNILKCGDTVLLVSGGHGFNILEDAKILEVKQGPYRGVEEDKRYLEDEQLV